MKIPKPKSQNTKFKSDSLVIVSLNIGFFLDIGSWGLEFFGK